LSFGCRSKDMARTMGRLTARKVQNVKAGI